MAAGGGNAMQDLDGYVSGNSSVSTSVSALPSRNVGPLQFTVASQQALLDWFSSINLSIKTGWAIHFANAYTVALADSDPNYAKALQSERSICVSDGMPVMWFGRKFHPELSQVWERVSGADFMRATLRTSDANGPKHFFLGSTPETLEALIARIEDEYPQADIAGFESPPFRELTNTEFDEQCERIRQSGATHVWVGLGTPKQDWEVERLASNLPVLALAVGAAFDFLAGTKKRAPKWVQDSGLEWAHRLVSEPRRLTKRYLWGNPRFVLAALRHRG